MITAAEAPHYLFGSLRYAGIDWRVHPWLLEHAVDQARVLMTRGHYHLPFFLIADLDVLLHLGHAAPFRSDRSPGDDSDDEEVQLLRARYEREFLGRLLQAPGLEDALEIADTSPEPAAVRARLLILLVDQFAPFWPQTVLFNPALLREVTLPHIVDLNPVELLHGWERRPADLFTGPLRAFLDSTGEAIRWGHLLREEDHFELSHLQVLGNEHLRVGCRQILAFDRQLRQTHGTQAIRLPQEDDTDTAFVDESHYPSGGLTGLTNQGSFENLVTSELIYFDEEAAGVSLFNLRYVEGELLFYLRDSGVLRRKRRTIHLILDLGPLFHVKSPSQEYQFSILAQGFCLRLLRDLNSLFAADSLHFVFHYLPTGQPAELREETAILQLLLDDYVRHGWVEFHQIDTAKVDLASLIDPRRKTYAVVLASAASATSWRAQFAAAADAGLLLHPALVVLEPQTSAKAWPQSVEATIAELVAARAG